MTLCHFARLDTRCGILRRKNQVTGEKKLAAPLPVLEILFPDEGISVSPVIDEKKHR